MYAWAQLVSALSDRPGGGAARAGQEFVAAPVFGRPEQAEAGKLAIVAQDQNAAIERCKPLWMPWTKATGYGGSSPSQRGQA